MKYSESSWTESILRGPVGVGVRASSAQKMAVFVIKHFHQKEMWARAIATSIGNRVTRNTRLSVKSQNIALDKQKRTNLGNSGKFRHESNDSVLSFDATENRLRTWKAPVYAVFSVFSVFSVEKRLA
jgi:hypothetical protein